MTQTSDGGDDGLHNQGAETVDSSRKSGKKREKDGHREGGYAMVERYNLGLETVRRACVLFAFEVPQEVAKLTSFLGFDHTHAMPAVEVQMQPRPVSSNLIKL